MIRVAPLAIVLAAAVPAAYAAPASRVSPLQARIAAAGAGERIEVGPGVYTGDLVIDRPVHLIGAGRPMLLGSGDGTVVTIAAPDVVIEGFDIDGRKGGDLGRDASGILIAAPRATVRDCRVRNTLFGIYLKQAPGTCVERCDVRGIKEKAAGEKGSGIHVWNTDGFTIAGNEIYDVRDGIYIQSSPHGLIRNNVARDLRYGLHYMYSDDNVFEGNVFERADAGTAVMFSRRLTFRRNQFLHNRGFASVGLLLQSCDDVLAEDNLVADNARGVFLEGSNRTEFRGNAIVESDAAFVLFASSMRTVVRGNTFVDNLSPLLLVGRRTDAVFRGNYWSDNVAFDLDGDGITDEPYRLTNVFDHLRGNLTAADLFSRSLGASALAAAERTFPALVGAPLVDATPLARPPVLRTPAVAASARPARRTAGLIVSALACAAGLVLLFGSRAAHHALVAPARST
jgi:nitrous oxidase accessory protein